METSSQVLRGGQNFLAHIVCKLQNSKKISHSEAETHLGCCEVGQRPCNELDAKNDLSVPHRWCQNSVLLSLMKVVKSV